MRVGLGLLLAVAATQAAEFTFVGNRSELGSSDSIDWSGLGPAYTTVPQSFSIATTGHGWEVGGSKTPVGSFERRDQGEGWNGNFAPGDSLLWTGGTAGPLSLTFATPVSAVGMQIQKADQSNPAFTATIEAFSAGNVSLGSFEREGDSSNAGDGSAIFVGVRSAFPNIVRLEVNVLWGSDFAINQVSLVPEPRGVGRSGRMRVDRLRGAPSVPEESLEWTTPFPSPAPRLPAGAGAPSPHRMGPEPGGEGDGGA
jgi:hypothetical protein